MSKTSLKPINFHEVLDQVSLAPGVKSINFGDSSKENDHLASALGITLTQYRSMRTDPSESKLYLTTFCLNGDKMPSVRQKKPVFQSKNEPSSAKSHTPMTFTVQNPRFLEKFREEKTSSPLVTRPKVAAPFNPSSKTDVFNKRLFFGNIVSNEASADPQSLPQVPRFLRRGGKNVTMTHSSQFKTLRGFFDASAYRV